MADTLDLTSTLQQARHGDAAALDALFPLVYEELRRLARGLMHRERGAHTLQTTALVHEAWMRMVRQDRVTFVHRKQFFGLAAQVMRRIVLPGALRRTLPAYSNEVVMMLHSTSLASAVPAMLDITAAASRIYSDFYLPFEAYLAAATLYLIGTFTLIGLFKLAERRYLCHLSHR